MNYYNEHDPKAASWLRELINTGLIPNGDVDERSIVEVQPNELRDYTQCHFFAGIGGWSLALELAGWPEDRPVWTGSCPCQPFSTAGKGLAQADERHLWPVFFNLIKECRPEHVFGEQVASAIGKNWLDGISTDLESENYACGATVLGAHSVGAPHIRQRLYWVAHSGSATCKRDSRSIFGEEKESSGEGQQDGDLSLRSSNGSNLLSSGLANSDCERYHGQHSLLRKDQRGWNTGDSSEAPRSGKTGGLGNSNLSGCIEQCGQESVQSPFKSSQRGSVWNGYYHECRDGKSRRIPTEPAFFPLVNGVSPARVGILRGAGNAIVPQVAAEFIGAFLDIQHT